MIEVAPGRVAKGSFPPSFWARSLLLKHGTQKLRFFISSGESAKTSVMWTVASALLHFSQSIGSPSLTTKISDRRWPERRGVNGAPKLGLNNERKIAVAVRLH